MMQPLSFLARHRDRGGVGGDARSPMTAVNGGAELDTDARDSTTVTERNRAQLLEALVAMKADTGSS